MDTIPETSFFFPAMTQTQPPAQSFFEILLNSELDIKIVSHEHMPQLPPPAALGQPPIRTYEDVYIKYNDDDILNPINNPLIDAFIITLSQLLTTTYNKYIIVNVAPFPDSWEAFEQFPQFYNICSHPNVLKQMCNDFYENYIRPVYDFISDPQNQVIPTKTVEIFCQEYRNQDGNQGNQTGNYTVELQYISVLINTLRTIADKNLTLRQYIISLMEIRKILDHLNNKFILNMENTEDYQEYVEKIALAMNP